MNQFLKNLFNKQPTEDTPSINEDLSEQTLDSSIIPDVETSPHRFINRVNNLSRSQKIMVGILSCLVIVLVLRNARSFLSLIYSFFFLHMQVSFFLIVFILLLFATKHVWSIWLRKIYVTFFPPVYSRVTYHATTAQQKSLDWLTRFREANRRDQWQMVKKPLIILIIVLLLAKYGYLFLPPRIATSFPGDTGQEAPLNGRIEVIFDKGVIKSSAEKAFHTTPSVPGVISWEGNQKLIFTPKNSLQRSAMYKVNFNGVVLSSFFIPLWGKKTINFETIGNPKIVLASPREEALEDMSPVTIVFDRQMVPLTTATNSALLASPLTISPEITGEGRWLGTTAYQFRPTHAFHKATTYKVKVAKGLRSEDNGMLEKDYQWQFSSERPRIETTSPKYSEQFASPTASIAAFFTQEINQQSAAEKFVVLDQNKQKVGGRVVVTGTVVGFYPSSPLSREKQYTAVVKAGITSVEGPNGMNDDYSWSFTVGGLPKVLSTTPSNNAKDITEQYQLQVLFKTPMDQESFEKNVTISPEAETKPSIYFSAYDRRNALSIGTYLGRSQTYTVTIGANVTDIYGVPLGAPYTFSFSTAAYNPSVSIYPFGTYFGAFNQQVIPRVVAQVINANKISYSLYKLKREDLLDLYRRRYEQQCGSDQSCSNWLQVDTSRYEKVRSWSEVFEAEKNTPVQVVTKVTNNAGDKIPSGFYFLEMQIPGGPHDNMVMIVSKSTLTVKKSPKQIFTWGVDQSTNNVVSNMKMQLVSSFGTVLAEGTSNNDGVFMKDVSLKDSNTVFVFGQKGDDVVVAASAWSQGIAPYDFGLPTYYNGTQPTDYDATTNYKLFLTADRPIYRPGQKIFLKGVIRKDSDGAYETITAGEKITVELVDTNNHSIFRKDIPTTSFGSFSTDFVFSKQASLGYYQITATYQKNKVTQSVQVEEYKRPEVAVSVTANKEAYAQGENADVTINGSYYFGAPVSNAPVTWTLQTQDYGFSWDKDWRFEFGDPDAYWSRSWWYYSGPQYSSGKVVTQGAGKTNQKGDLALSLPLDISKLATSQKMILEAVVNDNNNQSIAASSEITVHKGGIYAGLRPVSYANQAGKDASVEIVTVDVKGKEVANLPVTVEYYKRTWETVREKNPDDGLFYYTNKATDKLVSTATVTTDGIGRATSTFTPSEGGTYKVVGKVTDDKGNQNSSGSFLWVSGVGFSTVRANNDRIVLVTDKRDYLVGENLSVFVASPFASSSAKTLLTAERGSVLDYKIVETSETSNNFILPVPSKYTPNAFIGAVVVKGGSEVKSPPEFKIGYTEVKVTDQKQQVSVVITPNKKRYKPKETMTATIETRDMKGNPVATELAVGLVDKAVWDLSYVAFSDIYKTFYQPRNLEVSTAQLLTISIDRVNANTNLGSKGGSGGGCFTGDTPILMKGGNYKNIKDIKIGDIVQTRTSDANANLVESTVTKTFIHIVDRYLIINGQLQVTPVHKMYVNGKWMIAGEIQIGDRLLDKSNHEVPIYSIEQVQGTFTVYNLEIAKYHTFFAGDIYVHNEKGGVNDTSRSNFPETAYWNAHLMTNAQGKATVSIKLPDNLTTWRLSSIANSKDAAFGSSVSEVQVSRDVLIRPSLPRFLSVGDEAKLGAIIVNTSGQEQTITASIKADGVQIQELGNKQLTIADGEQVKVSWSTVTKNVKSAKITLSVNSGNNAVDAVEIILPVKSYSIPETVATAGQAKDTAVEKIVLPKELDATQGQASLSFSPSLGSASIESLSYLQNYPYDCTEQTTSRFMPAVYVYQLLKKAKLEQSGTVKTKQLEGVISDGIQRLNSQQHSDGGWGWWVENDSDPFITAYAYAGLMAAKKDFTVANQTMQRAHEYLVATLASGKDLPLDTQAYILYVLQGDGAHLSSYAANLYQRRFELSLEARVNLAMGMKNIPSMQGRAKTLYGELVTLGKKTNTATHWEESNRDYRFMGSNTTTTASMLEAMLLFDKKSPLIPEVVRYLMASRSGGYWSSTKDTAAVIKAVTSQMMLSNETDTDESYQLSLNGKVLTEGKFTQKDLLNLQSYAISIAKLKPGTENTLQISKSGSGNMYYNLNMQYFLPFSEIKPLERGMVVVRDFIDSDGNILSKESINQNSEVWVRLVVVAPEERHFVVIEDPLPAGLESVNESLKNVSTLSAKAPKLKDKNNHYLYFSHKEYRDDKTALFAEYLPAGVYEVTYRVRSTTAGRYHYPPAQAYELYLPDVSGHSDGGWIEVK